MKRKGGPSQQRGGGGGTGRRRGRGGGRSGVAKVGGGGRRGDGGDRAKRGRHHVEFEHQPEVKLALLKEDDIASDDEEDYEEPTSAYTTLLQTLQATNDSFAKAYAPRRREEEGGSESSEDEEEAASEQEEEGDSEMENELNAESNGVELGEGKSKDDGALEDEEEDTGSGTSEWEEVEDEALQIEEAAEVPEEQKEELESERLLSGASATICTDPFKLQMELELAETEITKFMEGKIKFKTEVSAAGKPHGRWLTNKPPFPKVEKDVSNCAVKERLSKHWQERNEDKQFGDFPLRRGSVASTQEHQTYMDAYVLHILNHVLKTRDLVTRNNEKLQRQQTNENGKMGTHFIDPPRDQGFTRPKVLILLPLRSTALKFVKTLIELAPKAQTVDVEHKGRFFDDFGAEDDEDDYSKDVNNGGVDGKEVKDSSGYKGGKPADFEALFSGNNDDHFRIGISFTRKSIKLYSDFYSSDIIVASPIGLVTKIGEAEGTKKDNKQDIDFLSSIEIVVVDYADVIIMQNWKHVVTVFDHLNRIPIQQHGTDFMRIREWYLNGHSRHYRQSVILSTFPDAEMNALFHRTCVNHAGKVKLRTEYSGVLSKVVLKVRQVYERIECQSIREVDDARFEFFTNQVYPRIKDLLQGGILLFTRSSLDFPRLRNFLKSQNSSFCLLGEYTKQSDISRGRSWFYHQKRRIMLYTERAHFYHRYKIRGIRELIFYSLPDHPQFYAELSNLLEGVENPTSTILFSKFDNLQLERIVGSSRSQRMLSSKNRTFMFC